MCVWYLILHTSSVCPGYGVTLYLRRIPCAHLSWVSVPDPVAGWSIVWCHLGYISAFPLGFGRVFIIVFWCKISSIFIALHTLRKSVLQAPVYHDHQERKRRSASLSSISIPNYIDYTFIPFFSLCRVLWALLFPLDLWATWLTLPICILENQFRSTEWFGLERTRIS